MSDEITTGDQGQPTEDTPVPPDVPTEATVDTPTEIVDAPQPYALTENERFVEVNGRKLIEVKDIYKGITFHKIDEGGNLLGVNADGCLIKL